jgi:D-tyrosyl-tRNA(Tyr) deacylase
MKLVIQRVKHAQVEVDGKIVGKIAQGAMVLVGVTHGDTSKEGEWLASKLANLRMFEDAEGKVNRSLLDISGEILVVTQFTLYADCANGRRPSFTKAALPYVAKPLCEFFVEVLRKTGLKVETGIFGAEMQVSLLNNGPVTLILERLPGD